MIDVQSSDILCMWMTVAAMDKIILDFVQVFEGLHMDK